jgi:high-affinity iron transporter
MMLPGFVLSLREGLEAALIIGILMGALSKIQQPSLRTAVWIGVAAASGLSLITALLLHLLGSDLEGNSEVIFEGSTMLAASVLLTWMIFWMGGHARSLKTDLESDLHSALIRGGGKALFFLAFISVLREGIELALYLTATILTTNGLQVFIGSILGLGAAGLLGVALFSSLVKLDLRRFFSLTGLLLILFAAGMAARGMREFTEIGWIPSLIPHVWDTNFLLSENSILGQILSTLFGYNGSPSLAELMVYLGYFVLVGVGKLLHRRLPARARTA